MVALTVPVILVPYVILAFYGCNSLNLYLLKSNVSWEIASLLLD